MQIFADAIPGSDLVLVMLLERDLLVGPVHSALVGQLAAALYETFVETEGGKGMDFSAMLPRFERRSRG